MSNPIESMQFSADNFTIDMFGRYKIANPVTLFDSTHRYRTSAEFSDEIVGGGTVTYLSNESTDSLNVGTTSGDKVTRESKKVFQYQPGKSLQVMQTFVMAPPKSGLRQRVGYFSRTNGVYLEHDGDTVNLVMRTYTSGSVQEIRVPQSSWDRRKMMNGDGPTLDLTSAQIFFTEYEWLGVGSVRCGFVIGGEFYTVHQFDHANWIKKVYMQTATLPIRYEIENTATTSTASSMKQICATVISNGGYDWERRSYMADRNTAISTTTTYKPLVTIRLAPNRIDSIVIPAESTVFPTSTGNYQSALILNATITGGTWVDSETGNVQYNVSSTAMSGGSSLATTYFSATNQASSGNSFGGKERLFLQLGRTNNATPVSDTLTLAVRNTTGTGDVIGALSWFDNI